MWTIERRLFLGDYHSGQAALSGAKKPVVPTGELAPFAGVVSLCPVPLFPDEPIGGPVSPHTEWLHHPIVDGGNGEDEFENALELALPFIEAQRERGNVLVHCAAGMSRSVSVIAALLCREGALDVDEAFARIANAKGQALREEGVEPELEFLIAPAWEFRACLRRLFR